MSDMQPAGTAERAGMLFAELRAWKDDSEKRGIPEIIAEIHRDRLWLALNYPTWEAACDALLGGLRVQLPRDDRREIVGQLRDEDLSTRAIATALGVGVATVHRDLDAGVPDGTPEPASVTGLDGKTYTRKAPIVHLTDAGEVSDDEAESLAQQFNTRASITARYPDLDIPGARDTDVIRVGHALDGVPVEQKSARLVNGVKWLQAQVRNGPSQPAADPAAPGDQIAAAINKACSDITKAGGADGFAQSWDHVDGFTRTNWAAAVADMASRIHELQRVAHIDDIRRIK